MIESSRTGDILVQPNPVEEGKDLEIDFQGAGPVSVSVDLGEWEEVPVDPATGKAKFKVPVGATVIVVADQDGGRVQIEVVSSYQS